MPNADCRAVARRRAAFIADFRARTRRAPPTPIGRSRIVRAWLVHARRTSIALARVDSVYSVHSVVKTSGVFEPETRKPETDRSNRNLSTVNLPPVRLGSTPVPTLGDWATPSPRLRVRRPWFAFCAIRLEPSVSSAFKRFGIEPVESADGGKFRADGKYRTVSDSRIHGFRLHTLDPNRD